MAAASRAVAVVALCALLFLQLSAASLLKHRLRVVREQYNEDNGYLHAKDHFNGDKKQAHFFHGDHDVQESDVQGKSLLGTQFGEASPIPVMTETVQGVHLDKHMDEEQQTESKKHDEGDPVFAGPGDDRDGASSTQVDDDGASDNGGRPEDRHRTSIRVAMNNENHLHAHHKRSNNTKNARGRRGGDAISGLGRPSNADSDIQVSMNNQNHIPTRRRHHKSKSDTRRYRYENEDQEDSDIMHPKYNLKYAGVPAAGPLPLPYAAPNPENRPPLPPLHKVPRSKTPSLPNPSTMAGMSYFDFNVQNVTALTMSLQPAGGNQTASYSSAAANANAKFDLSLSTDTNETESSLAPRKPQKIKSEKLQLCDFKKYCSSYMLQYGPMPDVTCVVDKGIPSCQCRAKEGGMSRAKAKSLGQQICVFISMYRTKNGKKPVMWDDDIFEIAYKHAQLSWRYSDEHAGKTMAERTRAYARKAKAGRKLVDEYLKVGTQDLITSGWGQVAQWVVLPSLKENQQFLDDEFTFCGSAVYADLDLPKVMVAGSTQFAGKCAKFFSTTMFASGEQIITPSTKSILAKPKPMAKHTNSTKKF